jgi:uncharacterized protein YjbI with pentapeptide repeats
MAKSNSRKSASPAATGTAEEGSADAFSKRVERLELLKKHGKLQGVDLQKEQFMGVDLSDADLSGSQLNGVTFEFVRLVNANLHKAKLRKANFLGANLTNARLDGADLRGANFIMATLKGASFDKAICDNATRFPRNKAPKYVILRVKKVRSPAATGSVDFPTFLKRLKKAIDPSRLKKATSMLKAERFQLFAEVKPESLAGIVRSQTNRDLVYSCRLANDGSFSCCTQNLKYCGGLQGAALCKHLLVLIVGLTKAEQLDPATVANWVAASKSHKPALDKDAMSETFMRYKGAEAGEVDWRPTETIPEDYYAL